MLRTGAGRRSIKSKIEGDTIVWRNNLPYMDIHNEGGEITITAKMKAFFWAMHIKAKGASGQKNVPVPRRSGMNMKADIFGFFTKYSFYTPKNIFTKYCLLIASKKYFLRGG